MPLAGGGWVSCFVRHRRFHKGGKSALGFITMRWVICSLDVAAPARHGICGDGLSAVTF